MKSKSNAKMSWLVNIYFNSSYSCRLSTHCHWMEKEWVYSVIHCHWCIILSGKYHTVFILISILKYHCTKTTIFSDSQRNLTISWRYLFQLAMYRITKSIRTNTILEIQKRIPYKIVAEINVVENNIKNRMPYPGFISTKSFPNQKCE